MEKQSPYSPVLYYDHEDFRDNSVKLMYLVEKKLVRINSMYEFTRVLLEDPITRDRFYAEENCLKSITKMPF